ncbi:alkyl/aryl-sulfatase [Flavobacterium pectinovorum]|uniref:alkyl/aryl-sulfatase n=1 Tax=Flavobacterium pectinovorum TaxID=29533 RepID=UPI001FAB71B4|nr:alkyl sulfatase dimerization domain-containing protein [Flavobacterium pectinovorum]MCI9846692.1 MBL fold metallo-hydrolase [Flavobacterium pectinovorum]
MKKTPLNALLIGLTVAANAQAPKQATSFTQKSNEAVYSKLNFEDTEDFKDAKRGFIATLEDGKILSKSGNVAVNLNDFAFIKGKAPATVNPALWRQGQLNNINGLFKITEGVYQVRSFDAANISFIETKNGYVVIDALTIEEASAKAYEFVKKHVANKPILAVIVTHSHGDHYGGLQGLVSAEDIKSGKVKFITPKGFYEEAVSENVLLGNVMRRRAGYQFGLGLERNATGQVDIGLGKPFLSGGTSSLLQPNFEIEKTGQTINIDGLELVFQLTPNSEAPAELTLFAPAQKVFFSAEIASHTYHNVLTPRGAKTRDAKAWAGYLDEAIDLFGDKTEFVVPSHTWPVYGHDKGITFLEKQRDLYKYVHDQTVHLANKGLNKDEIAEEIKLPAELAKEWYNRDFYGTVKHNAKATYQFYLGWWDGNPAEYDKLPQVEAAKKYVEWFGGEETVLKKANESFQKGEYRWVAEVLKHVVFANPNNTAAKNLQADAFEQIAYQSESGIWRDLYLSGAKELREGVTPPKNPLDRSAAFLSALTPEAIFEYLSITVDGTKAAGKDIKLRFVFPELKKNILVYLKNGVLHQSEKRVDEKAEFTLAISKEKFVLLLTKPETARDILTSEGVIFEGDPFKFRELASVFEPANPYWNIVTP